MVHVLSMPTVATPFSPQACSPDEFVWPEVRSPPAVPTRPPKKPLHVDLSASPVSWMNVEQRSPGYSGSFMSPRETPARSPGHRGVVVVNPPWSPLPTCQTPQSALSASTIQEFPSPRPSPGATSSLSNVWWAEGTPVTRTPPTHPAGSNPSLLRPSTPKSGDLSGPVLPPLPSPRTPGGVLASPRANSHTVSTRAAVPNSASRPVLAIQAPAEFVPGSRMVRFAEEPELPETRHQYLPTASCGRSNLISPRQRARSPLLVESPMARLNYSDLCDTLEQ
mmetsp:Transcript_12519/g.28827  ORF Transcript_12519/g.28827 Transcript_12519/m.28827 type:complete len:279 (-) Transcript_12519:10-846(-)